MLNFKKSSEELSSVTVHDGFGCSIDIPSRGYVDAIEYSDAMRLILSASEENRLHNVERDLVVLMLVSRFNLPKNTSADKILKFDDGSVVGAPMLKALFNHFMDELGAEKDMLKFPLGHYTNMTQGYIDVKPVVDTTSNSKRSKPQPVEA